MYFSLFIYILFVLSLTLFPIPIQKELIMQMQSDQFLKNNYIPFSNMNDQTMITQIGGNILLTLPMGFYIPFLIRKIISYPKIASYGFFIAMTIELLQFTISMLIGVTYRVTDIDDVILNTLGVVVGYLFFRMMRLLIKLPSVS